MRRRGTGVLRGQRVHDCFEQAVRYPYRHHRPRREPMRGRCVLAATAWRSHHRHGGGPRAVRRQGRYRPKRRRAAKETVGTSRARRAGAGHGSRNEKDDLRRRAHIDRSMDGPPHRFRRGTRINAWSLAQSPCRLTPGLALVGAPLGVDCLPLFYRLGALWACDVVARVWPVGSVGTSAVLAPRRPGRLGV